jgi:CRP-like cAMP-binding protein
MVGLLAQQSFAETIGTMPAPIAGNTILDLLLNSEGDALLPLLELTSLVAMEAGIELQRSGEPIQFAYFPLSAMLTTAWVLADGSEVITLGIGRDGAIHGAPETDLKRAGCQVKVQLPGEVIMLPAHRWQQFLDSNEGARRLLSRYSESVLARTQQILACTAKHDVESRFCRWLLDMHAWRGGKPLPITHQTLSRLLGVRRTTVTLIAKSLQDAGIIAYRRGLIDVTDIYALQQASCECHTLGHGWHSFAREHMTPVPAKDQDFPAQEEPRQVSLRPPG